MIMGFHLARRIGRSLRYRLFLKPFRKFIAPIVRDHMILKHKDFEPQIVVLIDGGLGSQLGQYVFGRSAALSSGLPVSYDTAWFRTHGKDINGMFNRNFELRSVFSGLDFREAPESLVSFYKLYFSAEICLTRLNYFCFKR